MSVYFHTLFYCQIGQSVHHVVRISHQTGLTGKLCHRVYENSAFQKKSTQPANELSLCLPVCQKLYLKHKQQ